MDDQKKVVSRLKGMIAANVRGRSDSSSSQENEWARIRKKCKKVPMIAVEESRINCTEHEEEEVLYWCKEDQIMVCKECLIFGKHRFHTALKGEEMRYTCLSL